MIIMLSNVCNKDINVDDHDENHKYKIDKNPKSVINHSLEKPNLYSWWKRK